MSRPKKHTGRVVVTTHLEPEIGREVERLALERGISRSAAVAALVQEALLAPLEHKHGALIEATIERVLHARLERVDIMAYKAARESYRSRWLTAALLELLGDRMPAKPGQVATALNTESYRKARASLGESEDGWQEPS